MRGFRGALGSHCQPCPNTIPGHGRGARGGDTWGHPRDTLERHWGHIGDTLGTPPGAEPAGAARGRQGHSPGWGGQHKRDPKNRPGHPKSHPGHPINYPAYPKNTWDIPKTTRDIPKPPGTSPKSPRTPPKPGRPCAPGLSVTLQGQPGSPQRPSPG